jgi:peptidyl-prolyl cis-trans isomerase-like 3
MSVTIHTSIGDVKFEIYCDTAPRTAFNFLALCASGAYDGTTFHRNIKGFMIQGGDTAEKTGTKGGESIWGAMPFPDEFHPNNLHDKRGILSMANKGMHSRKYDCYKSSVLSLTLFYCLLKDRIPIDHNFLYAMKDNRI